MDPYDILFYDGLCFPETHPESLAVLGRLMGLEAAEPATCRVLELGCATGANLIPMAEGLPGARFLGIDLSGPQVAAGNRLIERIGLDNVRLRQGDIGSLDPDQDPDLGEYDFIIAHGVYSWVPPQVRARLLWLARRLLAPNGICYLSYNVLPGWRLRGTLRDILLDACRDAQDPPGRLAAARAGLDRLARGLKDLPGAAATLLREEVRRLEVAPASYLYFEYLAEHHSPVLFRDFVQSCESAGLRYLCDTELHTQFPASLGDSVEAALADLEDGLDVEQWLDFLVNRGFRQSLLIRDDAQAEEILSLGRFARLSLVADLRPPAQSRPRDRRPVEFTRPSGVTAEVSHPLTKAVLTLLAAAYPDALPLGELLPQVQRAVADSAGREAAGDLDSLLAELFGLFARGMIQARLHPRRLDPGLPERPRARPLVRAWLEDGRAEVPTRDHGNLDLDPLARRLMSRLDGTRDLRALAADLAAEPDAPTGPGGRGGGASKDRPAGVRRVQGLVGLFHRYGLLEG
ncbi:MAG: methyltransferase regulatory domain-containing protein [Bdellovibrio bacteriovorus]